MSDDSLRTDSMSMVVSELSRGLVASPNKEVDTDPGKVFAILHFLLFKGFFNLDSS